MRFASVLAAAAIAVSWGVGYGHAQQGIAKAVPAEFPPASFTGRQYVDSKGCVFIRAGVDGAVNWVPRVTRGRKQICGFQPSLTATARATVRAPLATAPATATTTATVATPPKVVRRVTTPAPATTTTTTKRVATTTPTYSREPAPMPAPVKPEAPASVAKVTTTTAAPQPRRVAAANCTGASTLSRQYLSSNRHSVRCGPQTAPHVTERTTASANATIYRHPAPTVVASTTYRTGTYATTTYTTAATRIAPKHVYAVQKNSTQGVYVPEGYAPVWEDDRLNPRRAHQTYAGKAQMDALWTRTTPRRLRKTPVATEVQVTVGDYSGVTTPAYSLRPTVPATATVTRATPTTPAATPEVTSAKASHRYVQLGAFTDPANAKRVAQKLANSGLPARMGDVTRKGKSYTLVLAGPFSTQAALDSGLQRVRGMGYAQAVLRK